MQIRLGRAAKRGFDVVAALVAIVLLSPVLAGVAVAVRLRLGSPVIFRQRRTGRFGRRFTAWKFRTMTDARDAAGRLLPDELRLTRLGLLLRRLSLDELPQLVNVLRGDMSIVGPRPLLPKYDIWYSQTERRRFEVRPGITGLAQVAGRNRVRWADRLALDVRYVEGWSFGLDAAICARTVAMVLRREGVVPDQRALMLDLDDERAQQQTEEMSQLTRQVRELLHAG